MGFIFQEVLAFLGSKKGLFGGGREEQGILDSYAAELKGQGKKNKRRAHSK